MEVAVIFKNEAALKSTAEAILDCLHQGIEMKPLDGGTLAGIAVEVDENTFARLKLEVKFANEDIRRREHTRGETFSVVYPIPELG